MRDLIIAILWLGFIIFLASLFPLVFEFLFNHIAPLFWKDAPHITFWESVGILLLLGMTFSGMRISFTRKD